MKVLFCCVLVISAVVGDSTSNPAEDKPLALASSRARQWGPRDDWERRDGYPDWDRRGDYPDWDRRDGPAYDDNYLFRTKGECPENQYSYGLKTFAYYRADDRCYEIGSKGPCKENMRFYLESEGSAFGDCDCDATVGYGCGRPLVYSAKYDWCYPVYHQGPCKANEWVVLSDAGLPSCKPNPCQFQQIYETNSESDCDYWVSYKGKCVKTMSQGPCKDDEVLFWDASSEVNTAPRCTNTRYLARLLSSDISTLGVALGAQCLPGQKHTINGKCHVRAGAQATGSPFNIAVPLPTNKPPTVPADVKVVRF